MGVSILYPSRQNRLSYPSNTPRKLCYILPYGPRLILWARAHHITKPIAWARPGPMGPMGPMGPWGKGRKIYLNPHKIYLNKHNDTPKYT